MMNGMGVDVAYAREVLQSGGLVAIPTETVYGLAANALDAAAVAKIFDVKKRPFFDPLIVHISSASTLSEYADRVPDWAKTLSEYFWPGALTVVVPKHKRIPDIVTAGLDTVAIRVPNHSLTLDLLEQLDFPLAAPSANPFGYISPTTAEHVRQQLGENVDYILDGGRCDVGVESTIVAEIGSQPTILRLGGVTVEKIEAIIGPVSVGAGPGMMPTAPGMLVSHYAPRKRVMIGTPPEGDLLSAFLGFSRFTPLLPHEQQRILSPAGDLHEAARSVFAALRELDTMNVETIYVELVPEEGLGRAINDRLRRASAERA